MSDEILEPSLTKEDRRVLAAVPSEWLDYEKFKINPDRPKSIWRLGEELGIIDVGGELLQTLRGLEHLGFVNGESYWGRRGLLVRDAFWRRTRKGDEGIAR